MNGGSAPFDADREAAAVLSELRTHVNPARREHGASYFQTDMEILGVAVPDIRRAAKSSAKRLSARGPEEVLAAAEALIAAGTLEGRQAAYELLALRADVLSLLGKRRLDRLGKGNDNWASVDAFASSLVGRIWREGGLTNAQVERWADSPNPWWRRTALAATVPLNLASRGGHGDTGRTLLICERLASDPHPAVVKALSWALRSLVPHDPGAVREFLSRHDGTLASRVVREVTTKLATGKKNVPKRVR